jgi:hypothetical protein
VLNNLVNNYNGRAVAIAYYYNSGKPPFYNSTALNKILKYPPPYYYGGAWYYATPWLWVDGNKEAAYFTSNWKSKIDQEMKIDSPLEITIDGELDPATRNLALSFQIQNTDTARIEGRFYAALIEDGIAWNAGNGVKTHNHIPRIFWPGKDGEPLAVDADSVQSVEVNWNADSKVNLDNCTVVAFVQNPEKQANDIYPVYQGASRMVLDLPTTLREPDAQIPTAATLHQNYPNPFNPATKIIFDLPGASTVRLRVFDLCGREVSGLVNSQMAAGRHEAVFNGTGLTSGVYVCRLEVNNQALTKKMMLIR